MREILDRARRGRDARFEGRFFTAVPSTRKYCRPDCLAHKVATAVEARPFAGLLRAAHARIAGVHAPPLSQRV